MFSFHARLEGLPFELRNAIWQYTLMPEPRIVELDHRWDEDSGWWLYGTRTPTPIALRLCRESRNAVISLYPLCFNSKAFPSTIRFNLELDTLFLHHKSFDQPEAIFSFFDQLNILEVSSLRNLALGEMIGITLPRNAAWASSAVRRYFTQIAGYLENLPRLSVTIVHDVTRAFNSSVSGFGVKREKLSASDRKAYEVLVEKHAWWIHPKHHSIEFFEGFPIKLEGYHGRKYPNIYLADLYGGDLPYDDSYDCLYYGMRHVWGWWHVDTLEI